MTVEPKPETEEQEPDTYPAEKVRELRKESANYRERARVAEQKAALADDYAQRLHTELVRAKGVLTDPSDLPFHADNLSDDQKLTDALNALVESKPHLKLRRVPAGDIGQGVRGEDSKPQDFSAFFKN